MRAAVEELAQSIPMAQACAAFGFARSTLYRLRQPPTAQPGEKTHRRRSGRGLTADEQEAVYRLLDSERFCDLSPYQVYATLLDEGQYYCSISTMYRILRQHGEVQERRRQRPRPQYRRPELLATAPNQVWSWDITWLKGPHRWQHFYLYVILDVFSRYVPGWMLAEQESAQLAEHLIAQTCGKQGIEREKLTLHADRGAPMTAQTVAQLLEDLGVAKSHSRPYTPDDNPFSESQFKTLKYRPDYPQRFDSLDHARDWARTFFDWYNHHHHHSGIGLMTPATVHCGRADQLSAQRRQVLQAAYAAHPERFVKGLPIPSSLPDAVWINPPVTHSPTSPAVDAVLPGAQPGSRVSASESLRPLTQASTGPQSAAAGVVAMLATARV
jgi:putative transposase